MRTRLSLLGVILLGLMPALSNAAEPPKAQGVVGEGVRAFTVRPGYRVTLVAKDLGEARFLAFDDKGTLYVSQPKAGTILALRDIDSNGSFEHVARYITGKPFVQAMQFKDGWLWFATATGVYKS